MKILLTGGGTGGHITPLLAVSRELKVSQPSCSIIYVGERGGQFDELTKNCPDIEECHSIFAGKFRRYHGESWLRRILDIKTILLNVRDVFKLLLGVFEAIFLLRRVRPDVVFLKGGFVGVPIGLAAAMLGLPIVTHDSDALPGLANRLVGRWAVVHATALPAEFYAYPKDKVKTVGVLVEHNFTAVDKELQAKYKQQIGIPKDSKLLLITGGSTGAERVNKAVQKIIDKLLTANPELQIVHQVGKGKAGVYANYQHPRLQVLEFMQPMFAYTGAADLVVARASGNTLAELGTQGKAVIVIPNPDLTGGHQIKNAERLAEQKAAIVLPENQMNDEHAGLGFVVQNLLDNPAQRQELATRLQKITALGAAKSLADLLLGVGAKKT